MRELCFYERTSFSIVANECNGLITGTSVSCLHLDLMSGYLLYLNLRRKNLLGEANVGKFPFGGMAIKKDFSHPHSGGTSNCNHEEGTGSDTHLWAGYNQHHSTPR